jgi:hypothetical protein
MRLLNIFKIIILYFLFIDIAGAETFVMPEELVRLAQKHGYSQVDNYYEEAAGRFEPPYVYGYLKGPIQNSAVFWVKPKEEKSRVIMGRDYPIKSVLLIMIRDKETGKPKLLDKIEHINHPAGLSIYKDKNTTLEGFSFIDNPKKLVPKDVKLENNAIRSFTGEEEEIFYKYNDEWLVRISH